MLGDVSGGVHCGQVDERGTRFKPGLPHLLGKAACAAAAGSVWNKHDSLVFTSRWGEPLYPDTVTALMSKLIREHNKSASDPEALPHARLHDLRHLHATTLLLDR